MAPYRRPKIVVQPLVVTPMVDIYTLTQPLALDQDMAEHKSVVDEIIKRFYDAQDPAAPKLGLLETLDLVREGMRQRDRNASNQASVQDDPRKLSPQEIEEQGLESMRKRDRNADQPPVQDVPRELSFKEIKERVLENMRQKQRNASKRSSKAETTQGTSIPDAQQEESG